MNIFRCFVQFTQPSACDRLHRGEILINKLALFEPGYISPYMALYEPLKRFEICFTSTTATPFIIRHKITDQFICGFSASSCRRWELLYIFIIRNQTLSQ